MVDGRRCGTGGAVVLREVNKEAPGIFPLHCSAECGMLASEVKILRADKIPDVLDVGRWAPGRKGELLPSERAARGGVERAPRFVPRQIWSGRERLKLRLRKALGPFIVYGGPFPLELPVYLNCYGGQCGDVILLTVEDAGGLRPWAPVGLGHGAQDVDLAAFTKEVEIAYSS